MELNAKLLAGFRAELEKAAEADPKTGLQGAALGAIIGALLGGVTPHILAKMLTRNADLAAILGAMTGAGGLGAAGFILGKKTEEKK
ncbi:MAG: hypothetical protein ABFE07_29215 [Armatimonadia bacterium]